MLDVRKQRDLEKVERVQESFYETFRDSRGDGGRGVVQFVAPPPLQYDHVKNGRLYVNRQAMLIELAQRDAVGAEIGVLRGELSDFMLKSLSPAELHLFDIDFETFKIAEKFSAEIDERRVTLVRGDSSANLAKYPDGHFDWIYVDGDHSYEGCKKDMDVAVAKIRAGGTIFVNDYLMWSHTECRPYGVVYAANETCIEHGFEMIGFALHNGMYCDVALRRMV